MVLSWLFGRRNSNSPDSFERILSKLANQIQAQSTKLAGLRQRSRRYKALFTLYTALSYILYIIVIVFVVGWKEVGLLELLGVIGGPVCILSVRKLFDLYYNYRISNVEGVLEELQSRQKDTIEKLKAATKFSTTQSIIEKYGGGAIGRGASSNVGVANRPRRTPQGSPRNQQLHQHPLGLLSGPQGQGLTGISTPQQTQQQLIQQQMMSQQRPGIPSPVHIQQIRPDVRLHTPPTPGGLTHGLPVLNLPQTQPSSQQHLQPEEATSPKWYDRLLDVIIGEDETSAKNRYALICRNCRMVNGLAPPGTTGLNNMEGWGCARCGAWNGSPRELDMGSPGSKEKGKSTPDEGGNGTTRSKAREEQQEETNKASQVEDEDETLDGNVKEGEVVEEVIPDLPQPTPKPGIRARGRRKA